MFDKCETIGDLQRALYHLSEMDDCTVCGKIADRIGQVMNGLIDEIADMRPDAETWAENVAIGRCAGVIADTMR